MKSLTKDFTKTIDIGGVDVLLRFDSAQEDFSWEHGDKGASGFSSLQEAETDAIFWTSFYGDYLHHEHIIRAKDVSEDRDRDEETYAC